jgi:hypothetical protein
MDYKKKYIKYKEKYFTLKKEQYILSQVVSITQKGGLEKKIYDIKDKNHLSVIDYSFYQKIKDGLIKYEIINNVLFFKINMPIYHCMSIQNNTLSIAGISIYLNDNFKDEWNVKNIQNMVDSKQIVAKHIIDMPFNDIVEGVLLTDLFDELKLYFSDEIKKNIKKDIFGIIITITEKDTFKLDETSEIEEVPKITINEIYKRYPHLKNTEDDFNIDIL